MGKPFDRAVAKSVFQEAVDLLNALSVPFFAVQGTALGAWRDGGFVPDEEDIDFGMLYEVFAERWQEISKLFKDNGWSVVETSFPFVHVRVLKLTKNEVKVDLATFVLFRKDRRFCHNTLPRPKYAIVHRREVFEHTRARTMYDRRIEIPRAIEEYLELEYGENWRTPTKDSVSRTRNYDFMRLQGIGSDYLGRFHKRR